VMLNGMQIIKPMLRGIEKYMKQMNLTSLQEIRGVAVKGITSQEKLSRTVHIKSVCDSEKCTLCMKCITAYSENSKAAIELVNQKIVIHANCDGCSLCSHVCPTGSLSLKGI